MSGPLRILHVVPSFFPATRYGGPIQTLLRLCQELVRADVHVDVATTNADGSDSLRVPTDTFIDMDGFRVRYFGRALPVDYAPSRSLASFLYYSARRYDLLHITSLFSFPSLAAALAARHACRPYIVSPRGSLNPVALQQRRWKKVPYWTLLERRHLAHSAGIHASAESERRAVESLVPGAHVFVVPNGCDRVTLPEVRRASRRLVFLGRLHTTKGFDVLIPALSLVAREFPDVETIVAGPDDTGEWSLIERAIAAAKPRPRVRWVGQVHGPQKQELLASATAMVFPSHTESFGMAVLEALACGTPVVVSRNCPWSVVAERGAGFWVENTPHEVAAAVTRILRDPVAACAMGTAARSIAEDFSWDNAAKMMIREYHRAIARGGPRRADVE